MLEVPRKTIQWFLKTIHKIEEESSGGFSKNINLKIIEVSNIFLIKSTEDSHYTFVCIKSQEKLVSSVISKVTVIIL